MNHSSTLEVLKSVLRESLRLGPDAPIPDDMQLTGGEYDLDSLDALMLVTSVEKKFGIKIPNESLRREDFATVASLVRTIDRHRNASA